MHEVPTTVKNKKLVEKRREQIVLAAIKLFSQNGFHETTLRAVTREAGISYGNIYDYIGSKDDIFYLIHEYMTTMLFEALGRAAENQPDPLEKLRRMIRAEFTIMDTWSDAIMLLYQEGHVLKQPYLGRFLKKEHEHVALFEEAVSQCVESGLLRPCQPLVVANLIKTMVDAWVIKRWDFRGRAGKLEVEQAILDILFNGLSADPRAALPEAVPGGLAGKHALVAGGGTFLGSAIAAFAASRGMRVVCHLEGDPLAQGAPLDTTGITLYRAEDHGPMTPELFQRIEAEHGQIDVYIHDFGAGYLGDGGEGRAEARRRAAEALDANLARAQRMAPFLRDAYANRAYGRIILVAPWGWDQFADEIRCETVKAAVGAITRTLANSMAATQATVNCIVPGFIRTARPGAQQRAKQAEVARDIPMQKLGELEDITETLNFLAGDAAKYLTGQVFNASGGMS